MRMLPAASVTMNGEKEPRTITAPVIAPAAAPTASAAATASTGGTPKLFIRLPQTTDTSPPVAPTERFMPPAPITTIWARPTTIVTAALSMTTFRFSSVAKEWVESARASREQDQPGSDR